MKLYPITMEMKLAITDGDNMGTVTYGFPSATTPSPEDIENAIEESLKALPDEYRLMTRHEHFLATVQEKMGHMVALALPPLKDGEEWHDPEAATNYCSWGQPADDFEDENH